MNYSVQAETTPANAPENIDETPVIPKPLNVMPSKIKPVQSGSEELSKAAPENDATGDSSEQQNLDALLPRSNFAFADGFWNDATPQDVIAFLLASNPSHSSGRFARQLALKATLTPLPDSLSSAIVSGDSAETPYALRLNKLVDLGSFDDAQKLYKLNESAPPTPLAAKSGIEAMLGHGEIAVACLDQKTFNAALKAEHPDFWNKLDVFCQALLSPAAGNEDELRLSNASRAYIEIVKPTFSTAADINQLDMISTIALFKTGALSKQLLNRDDINLLDDKHLAILLSYAMPSSSLLPLLSVGLDKGMVEPDRALTMMKAIDSKELPIDYAAFFKEYFKDPSSPLLTSQLLDLANTDLKQSLLLPLYSSPEIAFPDTQKILNLRMMALSHQELSVNLVRAAYNIPESDRKDDKSGDVLLIESLLGQQKSLEKDNQNATIAVLTALHCANYPQKDTKNAYDNIFNLTPSGNYVMPIGDILSSLKKSADKKQINQVVIRSLALINDKPLDKLHPAALYQILEALNSAGLTEETKLLTRDVLGNIMKK